MFNEISETKRTEYKKIFNKFSYKSYMKLMDKFYKRAKKHFKYKDFDIDIRLNIFIVNKDKTEALELEKLDEITKEIFNNSKVIKIRMMSMSKPKDLITTYFNSAKSPKKISLHFPKKKRTSTKFIF